MHINLESDYAIRLVRVLAMAEDRLDSNTLAKRSNVSLRFTLKIMQKLVAADVVVSYKGAHGGYQLAKPANETTLRQVIEAVEGEYRFSRCLQGDYDCKCPEGNCCVVQNVFNDISQMVTEKLDSITFDQLIG
ncbi:MAG: Rrf2 family transcriptional regulator [Clostridia bacterium]|nr:Rrf2 family transcriptional regulator [Clostridia bacterium]